MPKKKVLIRPRKRKIPRTQSAESAGGVDRADDGGFDHTRPERFPHLNDLFNRWEVVKKKRGEMKAWINILKSYQRLPWKDNDGQTKPNFGRLRERIDTAKTAYVDFVTERDRWARIVTDEGINEGENKTWSDEISFAFQRYCIRPWIKRFIEVMLGVQDMLLYSKGALVWEKPHGCYPDSVPIESIWPDEHADSCADSFNLLFIQKEFSAVELFGKISDEGMAEKAGWRRNAVLKILKEGSAAFTEDSLDRVFRQLRENNVDSEDMNQPYKLVRCFVLEYGSSMSITEYIFAEKGYPKTKDGKQDINGVGYLFKKQNHVESFEQVVFFLSHTVARNFYEDPSLAQLIYTTCKTYDIVMNRILAAVQDNMRVYLQASTVEVKNKLQKMRHGDFNVLDPDVTLAQGRIERPIADAMGVVRNLLVDMDAGTGKHIPHEQSRGKTPKTAQQAFIDSKEEEKIGSAEMKIFNAFFTIGLKEMYRRWVDEMTSLDAGFDRRKKFASYLKLKGIPEKAYKPENVIVESILNASAGNVNSKVEGAKVVLATLATPHGSEGELRAKRDIVAGVMGRENVDAYLPESGNFTVAEDSLIGLENDSLSDSSSEPETVPVLPDHMHMRHIPKHIEMSGLLLQKAAQLFSARGELVLDDEGIILNTVTDVLVGVDNIGAHSIAHIQLASRGASNVQSQQLRQWTAQLTEIQGQQDRLVSALDQRQQERLKEARERNGVDPKIDHEIKMNQIKEEHEAKMISFKEQEASSKAEQLRTQSAINAQVKNALAVQKAEFDKLIAVIKAEIDEIKKQKNETDNNSDRGRVFS